MSLFTDFKKMGGIYLPKINIDEFLGREELPSDLRELLECFTNLIDRCLRMGGKCFEAASNSISDFGRGEKDAHIPVVLLYRQILENFDAISLLVKNSVADPIKPLLRSMAESYIYIEYLVENEIDKRGLCFIYATKKERLRRLESFDRKTERGKQFFRHLKHDKWVRIEDIDGFSRAVDSVSSEKSKLYDPIRSEYERTQTKKRRKGIKWYELYDGPANLEALATKVNLAAMYEILYRHFSDFAHNGQVITNLSRESDSLVSFIALRQPREIQDLVVHSLNIFTSATRSLLKTYNGDELKRFDKWYLSEVGPSMRELTSMSFINIVD